MRKQINCISEETNSVSKVMTREHIKLWDNEAKKLGGSLIQNNLDKQDKIELQRWSCLFGDCISVVISDTGDKSRNLDILMRYGKGIEKDGIDVRVDVSKFDDIRSGLEKAKKFVTNIGLSLF